MRELKGDWRDLFNGFMVALDLRKCFLALCGIVVTIVLCGGLTIVWGNGLHPDSVDVPQDLVLHRWWTAQCQAWDVIYEGVHRTDAKPGEGRMAGGKAGHYIPYSILFVLLFLAIWSYFGGAISRIAAYEIAKDGERIETRKALQFSRKKFWSFFWAPLICVIGFGFFALCNYIGGLVGGLLDFAWVGSIFVAFLLPLALLSGFIMTLIAVGTLTGAPLFAPAVAAEGTDAFDAVSRGFSYVYSRPWHFGWYQLVSWGYGYVCISFVILFTVAMCHLGLWAGSAGFELCGVMHKGEFKAVTNASWSLILSDEKSHQMSNYAWDPVSLATDPHPYGRLQTLSRRITRVDDKPAKGIEATKWNHRIAHFVTTLWLAVTLGLALGYVVSYFFSQQAMIYYILRKKVDGIEMNEVFEEQEEEMKPAEGAAGDKPMADAGKPMEASKPDDKPPSPPEEKKA